MTLEVLLPTGVLARQEVSKIIAEAANGYFCLEPRHADFVSALVPGVLSYVDADGRERFAAVDHGLLVKCAQEVRVCTLNGVRGDDLAALSTLVEERFLELGETERKARSALARLEAGALRGIRGLREQDRA